MDDFSIPTVNPYDTTFVRLVEHPLLFETVRALDGGLTYFGLSVQTNAETYRINIFITLNKSTTLSYKHNVLR